MQFPRYGSANFLIKSYTYIVTRIISCRIEYNEMKVFRRGENFFYYRKADTKN